MCINRSVNMMKERITVTLNKELLEWVDFKVNQKIFANRSHGFEYLIAESMRSELSKKDE